MKESIMRDRQRPLVELYHVEPSAAWVTDVAYTTRDVDDPLHAAVVMGPEEQGRCPIAVHTAVGGESDAPVPGDMLCAALAGCLDTTLGVVADHLALKIAHLSVKCEAEVDVRGTLFVSPEVPVGFQRMRVVVDLRLVDASEARRDQLLQIGERCCVVLQTLRAGLPVEVTLSNEEVNRAVA